MLSSVDYGYLWQRELRAGHAYDFGQLQRAVARRVDELHEEWVEHGWADPEDLMEGEQAELPLDVVPAACRAAALEECVARARLLMDLDGIYEEDVWFAYLDAMASHFDVGEGDGSAALWPWEEPNLQAARTMASTVPFGRFHPDSVELGW